jgi:hypothetical protein
VGFLGLFLRVIPLTSVVVLVFFLVIVPNTLADFVPVASSQQYYASKDGYAYHYPNCSHVKDISPENLRVFYSVEEAYNQGYSPCKDCNPPLPLSVTQPHATTPPPTTPPPITQTPTNPTPIDQTPKPGDILIYLTVAGGIIALITAIVKLYMTLHPAVNQTTDQTPHE